MEFSRDRMYPVNGTNPITGEPVTEYPSVTTITGLMNKPFLLQAAVDVAVDYIYNNPLIVISEVVNADCCGIIWDANGFDNARSEYSRQWGEAALFGTKVHAIAERYFSQKLHWPDKPVMYYEDDPDVFYTKEHRIDGETEFEERKLVWDDLFRKLYKGLHDWSKKNGVVPISMEEVVYGEGYAGRYDLIGELNGMITMIDIKTGGGSYYDNWKPQLAAYRQTKPEVQAHGFLKWNKDTEKWNYKEFSEDFEIDYQIFLAYRNVWWYNEIKKQTNNVRKAKKWLPKINYQ